MKPERRVAAILGVVALVAVPAALLRVLCVGPSCDRPETATRTVPFCSLPSHLRSGLASGYRDGRSPDILAVTEAAVRVTSRGPDGEAAWPSLGDRGRPEAPVVFWGHGVERGGRIARLGLDDVAPTLAEVAAIDVPHPEVRSGRTAAGVATGQRPRLLVQIVLRGVADVMTDPVVDALSGQGTRADADIESLPQDSAAVMTTIGTGGIPAEHGITGSSVRNDEAELSSAWAAGSAGPRPPLSVIATLADDLDEITRQKARIALVADTPIARGLVGGNWYVDHDRDTERIVATREVIARARAELRKGYATDATVDLVGISLRTRPDEGAAPALHALRVIESAVGNRFAAAIVVLPDSAAAPAIDAKEVARSVNDSLGADVIEGDTAGGFFLDQRVIARERIPKDEILTSLGGYRSGGSRVFADVFPGLAVAFARFC